jgi:hypothetical protein
MSFRTISYRTALEAAMKTLSLAMLLSLLPGLTAAGAIEDSMKAFVDTEVRSTLVDPVLVVALNGANAASTAFSPNDILTLDDQWRAEIGKDSALIKGIAESAMSDRLRDLVQASGGKITEVIVMDAQGLNIAVSTVTSDYWQGDEDKHKLTYGVGPNAVHVSEIELDESTQSYQAQVSFTITNPATGLAIGAATIGLNAESF